MAPPERDIEYVKECRVCGREYPVTARVCVHCGANVPRFRVNCGRAMLRIPRGTRTEWLGWYEPEPIVEWEYLFIMHLLGE